jgi:hypothetical protein
MLTAIFIIIYVIASLLTGLVGRNRRMGFVGTFLISLFITPLAMLLILGLTGPSSEIEWRRRRQRRSPQ